MSFLKQTKDERQKDEGQKDVRRMTNRKVDSGQWQWAEKRFKVESWQYGFGIHLTIGCRQYHNVTA